jgi:hypothetical protein
MHMKVAPTTPPIKFQHPGTFMSPTMTRNLRAEVAKSPMRVKALQKLRTDTTVPWKPQSLEIIDIGFGGGAGHIECTKDAENAVSSTLIYWATGEIRYATNALAILESWSKKNRVWKGDNGPLEAAWTVCSMARAAELLKYAPDASISKEWTRIQPVFFKWIDAVIMPSLKQAGLWFWRNKDGSLLRGNWHFSILCARMQLAILREDMAEWKWAVETYPDACNKALIEKKCKGENVETCRDVTHAQFLLGGLVQVPEMALHQGVNLYDERLIGCFELQARIMLKEIPTGLTKEDIKTPYGYWPEPVFEIPFAHFYGRNRKEMPHTLQFLRSSQHARPDRVTLHWGANTLTHAAVDS